MLHDEPFVRCVHVHKPAPNRHVFVRMAEGARFDFTDAPLWVEGVLRLGRFETFEAGKVAIYALDEARYEALPPERMDLPVFVPPHTHDEHPEGHRPTSLTPPRRPRPASGGSR